MKLFAYISVFYTLLLVGFPSQAFDSKSSYSSESQIELSLDYNPFASSMAKLSEYEPIQQPIIKAKKYYDFTSRGDKKTSKGLVVTNLSNENYSGAPDKFTSRVVRLANDRKDITPAEMVMQYRYKQDNQTTPYIGAGANYQARKISTYQQDTPKSLESVGYVVQAGTDYKIDSKTQLNLDLKRNIYDREVSTQALTPSGNNPNRDWVFGTSISYKLN